MWSLTSKDHPFRLAAMRQCRMIGPMIECELFFLFYFWQLLRHCPHIKKHFQMHSQIGQLRITIGKALRLWLYFIALILNLTLLQHCQIGRHTIDPLWPGNSQDSGNGDQTLAPFPLEITRTDWFSLLQISGIWPIYLMDLLSLRLVGAVGSRINVESSYLQ